VILEPFFVEKLSKYWEILTCLLNFLSINRECEASKRGDFSSSREKENKKNKNKKREKSREAFASTKRECRECRERREWEKSQKVK